ncbi:MAG: EFR1 family ferrodoxin [Coriobacteriales bacterium]|jgi:ferredoxin/flavodoxin|nr:EFR1 family ferrodoxin [Coriobacteriales bacterium]
MERFAIYYFSATGNSLAVARSLSGLLKCGEPISIPGSLVLDDPYYSARIANKVGFVFPVHRAGLPEMVKGFISGMPVRPNCYYFAVSTYTLFGCTEFQVIDDLLSAKGAELNYATSVRMMGSVGIIDPSVATVRRRLRQMQEQMTVVAEDIANSQEEFCHPSWRLLGRLVSRFTDARRQTISFHVGKRCTRCGICAQVCPAQNIHLPRPTRIEPLDECGVSGIVDEAGLSGTVDEVGLSGIVDEADASGGVALAGAKSDHYVSVNEVLPAPMRSKRCEACMACVHWCPNKAIRTHSIVHSRYHNPDVTPADLNRVPATR